MTGGFIAGIILGPLLFLVFGALAILFWRGFRKDYDGFTAFLAVICAIISVGAVVVTAVCMVPYDMAYHSYRTHAGTVTSNNEVQLGQDWVVTFAGSNVQYDCIETRCAQATPGTYLQLRCVKQSAWQATDAYLCKFGNLNK